MSMQQTPPPSLKTPKEIQECVDSLLDPEKRNATLTNLAKCRESIPDLHVYLWNTPGVLCVLACEFVSVYPRLQSTNLDPNESMRVCNALALLQSIASNPDLQLPLLHTGIHQLLFPFLRDTAPSRQTEFLRVTSLGVIGALVKKDNTDVIEELLRTDIVSSCLHIMQSGRDLSKTVSTFIIEKVLRDPSGMKNYICLNSSRVHAVAAVLAEMLGSIQSSQFNADLRPRILKHAINCADALVSEEKFASEVYSVFTAHISLFSCVFALEFTSTDEQQRASIARIRKFLEVAPQNHE